MAWPSGFGLGTLPQEFFAHSRKLAGAPNIRSFIAFLLLCFDTATRLILTSCHVGATKLTKIWHQKIINCRSSTQFQKRISTAKQSKQGCCTKNTTLDNIMITLEPVENLGALLSVADCGIWQVPRTGQALRCETFTAAVCPPVFSSSCRYAYSVDVCWLAESPWCCSRVKNKKNTLFPMFPRHILSLFWSSEGFKMPQVENLRKKNRQEVEQPWQRLLAGEA